MSEVKRSSGQKFENVPLKRWLFQVGSIRRKILLKKFKNSLIHLELPRNSVRNGLCQLISCPVVNVFKNNLDQGNCNREPESSKHEESLEKILAAKKFKLFDETVTNNNFKDKNSNEKSSEPDTNNDKESSASGINFIPERRLMLTETKLRNHKSLKESRKGRVKENNSSRRRRRSAAEGNPNGIIWRLIEIDVVNERPKPSVSLCLMKRCEEEKKKKKQRLLEKFTELFGEDDDDVSDNEFNLETTSSKVVENQTTDKDVRSEGTESEEDRKSPIFCNKGKKRKRIIDRSYKEENKNAKLLNSKQRRNIWGSIDNESSENSSNSDCDTILERELRDLGLFSESENESVSTVGASTTSMETLPITREKYDLRTEKKDETVVSNLYEDSMETIIYSNDVDVKTKSAAKELLNIGSTSSIRKSMDFDPNPSSTTDTEQSELDRSGLGCISDRLLGALDNIFLALLGRRRFKELELAASKLAIEKNRLDEICQARQEFKSKLRLFNQELFYLYNRIESRDEVLSFIAQGLDNRTPSSMKPFTKTEVEAAINEADFRSPSPELKEPLGISNDLSSEKIICTIDLTEDDAETNVGVCCDSSTDPFSSQNKNYEVIEVEKSWDCKLGEIQQDSPSITEVKTISPKQFETMYDPCLLCSQVSTLACKRCYHATYCSKNCQELHWVQTHHVECIPFTGVIYSAYLFAEKTI